GGASTAARLRRLDENVEIKIFERGKYISYANCGLPYYVGNVIKERDSLLVQTTQGMKKRFNIDIYTLHEVLKIDRANKSLLIKNLKTNEIFQENYDILVLSSGAEPIKPPIKGIDYAENVFILRDIPDADKIKNFIETKNPKKAVVIGGGFIGIEIADSLLARGMNVTIVEKADQILVQLDKEMANILHKNIKNKGVDLILADSIEEFKNNGKTLVLSSGKQIDSDLTILSIGVKPESNLAKEAGLDIGITGGVKVNEYLQTSDESIYAIGDVIEVKDFITGLPTLKPLAGPANKQGRIVANNICGKNEKYLGTIGTSVVKVFDMTAASIGNNEKILKKSGISYETIHITPPSHATYYPGATTIFMKLIFDKNNGKIYGAQAVGYDGVDKRIDVLSTAIMGGMTVMDLQYLELAYAPPFSSAKDPVNMLGYVATNVINGDLEIIHYDEFINLKKDNVVIVDVCEPIEREKGYIDGSINIPLNDLRNRLNELPKDKMIYVYCQQGLRSYIAYRILKQNGFKVKSIDGGYRFYLNY
ncbi:MAG TPA: FAD-dependent oxidoreductase, partial [Bacteroidales bacterium]|nr:FAD-dependent oxidoreductase [Bacteroidales bacterium]